MTVSVALQCFGRTLRRNLLMFLHFIFLNFHTRLNVVTGYFVLNSEISCVTRRVAATTRDVTRRVSDS